MLKLSLPLLLLSLLVTGTVSAQDVRYVSDKQYVPLRSGSSSEHRIIHRGIPSGTRLIVGRSSSDGDWAEVTTDTGLKGWIRSQYLMSEMPARQQLARASRQIEQSGAESADLLTQLQTLETEREELHAIITASDAELGRVKQELHQLKQVSGKAVQLDSTNRKLVEESDNLHSKVEMLQAENQRLSDKLQSGDFMNGALAVLLGVIIALVAPRLVPKRRKASSW